MPGLAYEVARRAYLAARRARGRLLNRLDPPILILIYHRVASLPSDPQLLAVSPPHFRDHLGFLKDNFAIARFEDDWSRVDKPAVVVTFDDGYADNVLQALPIVEEVGVPVTFFVSTGNVGTTREFWWDELERLVLGRWEFSPQFTIRDGEIERSWSTASSADRQELYRELHRLMLTLDPARRVEWIARLREWAQASEEGREVHRPMTVDEMRRLAASRWATVGAHTVSHSRLSALPVAAQRAEIFESKQQLEAWIGREVRVFSYPFGRRADYTRATRELCREAGFEKAAANFRGQVHAWTDRFQLPRLLVRDWPLDVFTERLKVFWEE
jgi:peptidoglycan/xylan/chitin deacetylase (PgdA/CDA1 family)